MTSAGVQQVRCAAHGNEALATIAALGEPVITVMDFWLEDGASLEFVHSILALAPGHAFWSPAATSTRPSPAGPQPQVRMALCAKQPVSRISGSQCKPCWPVAPGLRPGLPSQCPPAPTAGNIPHERQRLGITARQAQVLSLLLQGKPIAPLHRR